MIFSDRDLVKGLKQGVFSVSPVSEEDIQPCSIDLHLDNVLKTVRGEEIKITPNAPYLLKPQEFVLGSTRETIRIGESVCGIVNGKSSLARIGLMIHVTAGYIDAGYYGNITLELFNCSNQDIILKDDMEICQLVIEALTSPVIRAYGSKGLNSHYQGSKGVVNSKL